MDREKGKGTVLATYCIRATNDAICSTDTISSQDNGGRRRGGWFASYWLDCAHRDVRYGLRLDIELDGRAHLYGDRPTRDALLRQRGWYIVRLPGTVLHTAEFDQAVGAVAALADQHRRAVVLARSESARS